MPNEFVARNGIISLNNTVVTGSVIATGGFTGSLFGTSSWATNALTASSVSGTVTSASYALTASSATFAASALTASYFVTQSVTNATSASYAATASSADNFLVRSNLTSSNALITGTITAQTLVVSTVSSSVVYSSGSNTFGNSTANVQQFTGSLRVTGSGDHYIVGGNVGIGTTSPSYPLHVYNTSDARILLEGTTNFSSFNVRNTSGNLYFGIDNSAGSEFGNGAYTRNIYSGDNYALAFTVNNLERMRITSGGNLLVGTTTDSGEKLVVSGSGKFSGNLGIGTTSSGANINVFSNSYGNNGMFQAFGTDGLLKLQMGGLGATTAFLYTGAGNEMQFFSGNVLALTLASNQAATFSSSVTATSFTGSLFGTASQAISASYAATASLALAVTGGFSKSFAIVNNSNISATDVGTFPVWRCSTPCTASMILGYTDSGSAVLVNARKNTSNLLASDLSITTDTWVSSSTLQNQNFNLGDILSFTLVSFSSTPKEITIQANFNY